ncbi:MAG: hypothetical protein RL643_135 [Actinomycetota bacterium]
MWHAPEQIDDHSAWLVECINEYSTATRDAAQELEKPLPTLSRGGPPEAAEMSDSELIAVADSWFEVFRAAPDADAVASALNELLASTAPVVVAVAEEGSVRSEIRLSPSADTTARVKAWGAIVLMDVVASLGVDRIGFCTGRQCVDVYIDRSPRHNRRYCSELCQTRERVRRHRDRT